MFPISHNVRNQFWWRVRGSKTCPKPVALRLRQDLSTQHDFAAIDVPARIRE